MSKTLILSAITLCVAVTSSYRLEAQEAPARSAEIFTLGQCIEKALVHSPAVDAAEYDVETVRAQLSEAKGAYFLPELKLRVLGGPVPDVPEGSGPEANFPKVDTNFFDLGPFIQARVEALQPLFTFGKLSSLKKAAEAGVSAKESQKTVVANDVIYKVKSVYHGLSYLYSLDDFLQELQSRIGKARERVNDQIQKHSPDVTDIDLMRLDLVQSETGRRVVELSSGIKMAKRTLAVLMGLPEGQDFEIADKMLRFRDRDVQPLDVYLKRARQVRPEIKALSDSVVVRKELMDSSKADFFPMFFLGGFYGFGKAPGRQHVDSPYLNDDFNFQTGGVAFGLEQKLAFHMTNSRHEKARAEYMKMLADQRQALEGIELQVRKAHSDAEAKRESVKIAETGFRAGRSWVLATTLNFGVGLVPVKDLLEAFVAYSRVKVGFLDTIHDFDVALADLSKAVGEEISYER